MGKFCSNKNEESGTRGKEGLEGILFLGALILFACVFFIPMGVANALNTMMNTAYRLLVDTTLYIMAIAVLAGALSEVLTEFGVVALLNKMLSPLMHPLYAMPGAAALGVVTTYFSDNPAIITLANNQKYRQYFTAYQIPALTNLGTAFGMGLIVTTYMLGLSGTTGISLARAVLCGNLGAVAGSILSTRLMLMTTAKEIGKEAVDNLFSADEENGEQQRLKGGVGIRLIDSLLKGGRIGVDLGLGIIPGVLVICTLVMMLTYGPSTAGVYTGEAYEGVALLPALAEKLRFIIEPLFGFSSAECIAVPVTALGSAGASLGIVGHLLESGAAGAGDIAVFTAMCMCWSGYLSTHVSVMDVLGYSKYSGKSILWHTLGGLFAGVAARWLYMLLSLL